MLHALHFVWIILRGDIWLWVANMLQEEAFWAQVNSLAVGVKCSSAQVAECSARQISFRRIIGRERAPALVLRVPMAICQLIRGRS